MKRKSIKKHAGFLLIISCILLNGCNSTESENSEPKVSATTLNACLKEDLKKFELNNCDVSVNLNIKFNENETIYKCDAKGDIIIKNNPFKSKAELNISGNGASQINLDLEAYLFLQEEVYVQLRDNNGEYVRSILANETKNKICEIIDKEEKLFSDESINKILTNTKGYSYTGKTKISGEEYDTLTGYISDDTVSEKLNEYLQNADEDIATSVYIDYIPDEFGELTVEIYFDKSGKTSGIMMDFNEVLKKISGYENAVGKIQIMYEKDEESDIIIPDAKMTSLEEVIG